jgi:hypothetical protein
VVEGDEVDYIREATGFPGVEMILRVESEIKKAGVVTGLETRYFITSLGADEASPKRLMDLVRGHWGSRTGCISSRIAGGMKTASGVFVRVWRSVWPHCVMSR